MTRAAPRLDARLVALLARLDDPRQPIAETSRRLGTMAERLGLPRPSYEQVRVVVHALRARRRDPGLGEVLLDIQFKRRPPEAFVDGLLGTARPLRRS